MQALREYGVNICLGTDSLASNNALDMRSEMREAQILHGLGNREVLEMVLLNGARALGQAGKLGQISPGSVADLVAFPHAAQNVDWPGDSSLGEPEADPYRRVIQSHEAPNLLLVNGREVEIERLHA